MLLAIRQHLDRARGHAFGIADRQQVSALAVNSASPYLNFNAAANTGTAYEFDFNVTGTTTAVLKLTGVVLTSGHKYTIYIAGPGTALQGIVTQDL